MNVVVVNFTEPCPHESPSCEISRFQYSECPCFLQVSANTSQSCMDSNFSVTGRSSGDIRVNGSGASLRREYEWVLMDEINTCGSTAGASTLSL